MERLRPWSQFADDLDVAEYDTDSFPFRRWFVSVLGTTKLESLHTLRNVTVDNYALHVKDLREFCEKTVSGLQALIEDFLKSVVTSRFGPLLGWQEIPTIRFHFSVQSLALESEVQDLAKMEPRAFLAKHYFNGHRLAMFHRDRDYGLASGCINLWVPITDAWGANALWLGKTKLDGRDAEPIALRHGQALFFDGANRWHGAVWNTSGVTRVSFDVRFRPKRLPGQLSRRCADSILA